MHWKNSVESRAGKSLQMRPGLTEELGGEQVGAESFAVDLLGVHLLAVRVAGVHAHLSELTLERVAERVHGVRDVIH